MTIEEIKALYPVGTVFDSLGGNMNVKILDTDRIIYNNRLEVVREDNMYKGRLTNNFKGNNYNGALAKIISKPLNEITNNYEIY